VGGRFPQLFGREKKVKGEAKGGKLTLVSESGWEMFIFGGWGRGGQISIAKNTPVVGRAVRGGKKKDREKEKQSDFLSSLSIERGWRRDWGGDVGGERNSWVWQKIGGGEKRGEGDRWNDLLTYFC